ncbi:MAG TPA: hypothetical protein VFQ43_01520, partial [Nitrososphaera sp.]|nr:hypothetical protein [Nitrososphaera sp.]
KRNSLDAIQGFDKTSYCQVTSSITHPSDCLAEHVYVQRVWTNGPCVDLSTHRLNGCLINPTLCQRS